MNNFKEARAAMLRIMLSMQGAGLISDFEEIITTKNMIKGIVGNSIKTPTKVGKGVGITQYLNLDEHIFYQVLMAKGKVIIYKASINNDQL